VLLPASRSALTGTQVLDAGASDALGVTSVSFVLTGGSFDQTVIGAAAPTFYGWLAGWNTSTVPDGSYTLQSLATNTFNLSTYSAGVPVTVVNPRCRRSHRRREAGAPRW